MEQSVATPPRHRAVELGEPPHSEPIRSPWRALALWGGRVFLVLTVVTVVLTGVTRDQWTLQGFDAEGAPRAVLPNVATGMALFTGIVWHWVFGLWAVPAACWRDGRMLMAPTVWGRRRLDVEHAVIVPFRLFGQSGTVHGAFLLDRRVCPLLLLEPFAGGGSTRIRRLTGRDPRPTFGRACLELLLGAVFMLVSAIVVAIVLGAADVPTGMMGHP